MTKPDDIKDVGQTLARYYQQAFEKPGTLFERIDCPKEPDALMRYRLHCRAMEGRPVHSILDVGCGPGLFYGFLQQQAGEPFRSMAYCGVDIIPDMIATARSTFPHADFRVSALEQGLPEIPAMDFVVANGIFTLKSQTSDEAMWAFIRHGVEVMWSKAKIGLSFNLMTSSVDYRYDRLFYAKPGAVVNELMPLLGRRFVVFHDSRLFESFYVWLKEPAGLWAELPPATSHD